MEQQQRRRQTCKLLCVTSIFFSVIQAASFLSSSGQWTVAISQIQRDMKERETNSSDANGADTYTTTAAAMQLSSLDLHIQKLEEDIANLRTRSEEHDKIEQQKEKWRDERLSTTESQLVELENDMYQVRLAISRHEKILAELKRPATDVSSGEAKGQGNTQLLQDFIAQERGLRSDRMSKKADDGVMVNINASNDLKSKMAQLRAQTETKPSHEKLQDNLRIMKAQMKAQMNIISQQEQLLEEMIGLPATTTTTTDAPVTTQTPAIVTSSDYAYVFMIGGVNPEDFSTYRGYLFNILIAAKILRQQGSTADMVLWLQIVMKTDATTLPVEHEKWLEEAGIRLRYLPKTRVECFQNIIMEKFRILSMTEYRRILFLDSDLLPLGNLDYFFELSDGPNAMLKENMILAGRNIPMCAGFFMMSPKEGDYERAQQIIHEKYLDAYKQGIINDVYKGWGHPIEAPDYWQKKFGQKETNWTWYGNDVVSRVQSVD